MNARSQSNKLNGPIKKPVKTLILQVAVSEPEFQKVVRVAFDRAKSTGQEVDLAFNLPSDAGTAPLVPPRLGC